MSKSTPILDFIECLKSKEILDKQVQEESRRLLLKQIFQDYEKQKNPGQGCSIDISNFISLYEKAGGKSFENELQDEFKHHLPNYYIGFTHTPSYFPLKSEPHKKETLYCEIDCHKI